MTSFLPQKLVTSKLSQTPSFCRVKEALTDISFEVRQGESLGIIGLNGSGKSTLLQILASTLQCTNGSFRVNGRVAALLELGSGFNPEFTGRENVYLNGAIYGFSKVEIDNCFQAIEEFSGIGEYIDQPVRTYSSGMMVRLAFAVITQLEADIIIVDEALAVGDVYFQHKCTKFIQGYIKEGGTLLFVSHDPSAVKRICSRAILLNEGRLVQDGPVKEVFDYYNALVAKEENQIEIAQRNLGGITITESGSKEVYFESVSLVKEPELPIKEILFGEEVLLKLLVKSTIDIPDLSVGFSLRDRFGTVVLGTNTAKLGKESIKVMQNQTLEIVYRLKMEIGPGEYSISVALHRGAVHLDENFHWIDGAKSFKVAESDDSTFEGIARFPVSCQVK